MANENLDIKDLKVNEDGTKEIAGKTISKDGTVIDSATGKVLFISRSKMLSEEHKADLDKLSEIQAKLVKTINQKSKRERYELRAVILPAGTKVVLDNTPRVIITKQLDRSHFDLYLHYLGKELTDGGNGRSECAFKAPFRISYGLNRLGNPCYIWDLFIAGKKYESDYVKDVDLELMEAKNFLPEVEERIYSEDEEFEQVIDF